MNCRGTLLCYCESHGEISSFWSLKRSTFFFRVAAEFTKFTNLPKSWEATSGSCKHFVIECSASFHPFAKSHLLQFTGQFKILVKGVTLANWAKGTAPNRSLLGRSRAHALQQEDQIIEFFSPGKNWQCQWE